jgi:hypothetical protein
VYARLFFECDGEIDRALAEGTNALDAARRALDKYDASISSLRASGDEASLYAAAMLEKNRDMLCSPHTGGEYGDPSAKIIGRDVG